MEKEEKNKRSKPSVVMCTTPNGQFTLGSKFQKLGVQNTLEWTLPSNIIIDFSILICEVLLQFIPTKFILKQGLKFQKMLGTWEPAPKRLVLRSNTWRAHQKSVDILNTT